MGKLSWSGVVDAGRPTFLVSRIAAGEVCSPVRTMQPAVSGGLSAGELQPAGRRLFAWWGSQWRTMDGYVILVDPTVTLHAVRTQAMQATARWPRRGAHLPEGPHGIFNTLSACPCKAPQLPLVCCCPPPPKSHREPVLRPVPPASEPASCILPPPAPRATTSPTVPPPVSLHLAHRPVPVLNPTPACAPWPSTPPGCPCLWLATAPRCRDQGSWAAGVCFSLVLIGLPAAPQ